MHTRLPLYLFLALALAATACQKDPVETKPGEQPETPVTPQEPEDPQQPEEPGEEETDPFESAAAAVADMGAGWNLGNTLDSNSGDAGNMWIEAWTQRTPKDYETAWGQPQATR